MTTTLLSTHIQNYLTYCKNQKRLDEKTLKAYRIDLAQFAHAQIPSDITDITPDILEEYVAGLHEQYKPRTVKRKIASLKTFFHYLLYKDFLPQNPFDKLQLRFREPIILPKNNPISYCRNASVCSTQTANTGSNRISTKKCIKRYCRTGTTLCNGYSNLRALLSSQ